MLTKLLAVKFTRNPKFTPATLTAREMARCERIAKAYFQKHQTMRMAFDKGDGEQVLRWVMYEWKRGDNNLKVWLDNDARYAYAKSCVNYLIACGLNSGELERSGYNDSRKWAWAKGYYN